MVDSHKIVLINFTNTLTDKIIKSFTNSFQYLCCRIIIIMNYYHNCRRKPIADPTLYIIASNSSKTDTKKL